MNLLVVQRITWPFMFHIMWKMKSNTSLIYSDLVLLKMNSVQVLQNSWIYKIYIISVCNGLEKCYGNNWWKVLCEKGLSAKVSSGFVGCSRHRFNIVVESIIQQSRSIVGKVQDLMKRLKYLVPAARLRNLTSLPCLTRYETIGVRLQYIEELFGNPWICSTMF